VAEGIETDAQWSGLKWLGCEVAQGYRFSPPLPAIEPAGLLAER
jgi:EAL domain-containing protein (putative c-di-GMP-specific phosphodiesterase class I)